MDKNLKAVFFGSIGTIAETSEIQRRSYNLAFKKFGIDCYWNVANYCSMLSVPGGKERVKDHTVPNLCKKDIETIHSYKEEFYSQLIEEEDIIRGQFVEVFHHCKASEIKLGLVTTTSKNNIDSLSKAFNTKVNFSDFDIITTNTDCKNPKPDPEVYEKALKSVGLKPEETLAIEDTQVNLHAPTSAKIKTILFPGEYSNYDQSAKPTFDLMNEIFQL